jgi:hypothetical protein
MFQRKCTGMSGSGVYHCMKFTIRNVFSRRLVAGDVFLLEPQPSHSHYDTMDSERDIRLLYLLIVSLIRSGHIYVNGRTTWLS